MLVLALDTTTRGGSVAVMRDGTVSDYYSGDAALTHGERLPGDVMRLLERQQVMLRDIDLFAVAVGPGSFTGLRIGIATMQGFALAHNRSLIGISALDAMNAAVQSATDGPSERMGPTYVESVGPAYVGPVLSDRPDSARRRHVATWMDAQRGEVFSALYEGRRLVDGPSVEKPADVLARWQDTNQLHSLAFVGEGSRAYADLIRRQVPDAEILVQAPLLAPSVARLADEQAQVQVAWPPDAIRPIYVRRPDAELARDRHAAAIRPGNPVPPLGSAKS
jgi:tRNA threonylcarbamoyl adenosine modification protein YeaZ